MALSQEYQERIAQNFKELRDLLDKAIAGPLDVETLKSIRGKALGAHMYADALANEMTGYDKRREAAFDKVKNKKDWKAPIRAVIAETDREITEDAILFFTSTEATFTHRPKGELLVTAEGYRMGPAGDH